MKKWLISVITICLVVVALVGCAQPETKWETVNVTRGDLIMSVTVSGNLSMPGKINLAFGTMGTVDEIMVSEGDMVSEGQVLAKLDTHSLELNVKMAQIEFEMAKNNLKQTIYPNYTTTYATDLPGVWLALDKAQDDLEKAQRLLEQGEIEEAQASLKLVGENISKAQDKSQDRGWDLPFYVKSVELQADEAQIALELAKLELAKAIITAPFDGIVTDIEIKEGDRLSANNPAICLVDPGKIEMCGVIDEVDIAQVGLEQEAIITLDALPDKELRGKVTFISPTGTVRAGVVSYKTTVTLENSDEKLRDGMSATAKIIIEHHKNVLLIKNRAIQGPLDNPWVEVVTAEGKTESRQVTLGLSDGINTEVLSGLEEGEKVVLPPVSQFPFLPLG